MTDLISTSSATPAFTPHFVNSDIVDNNSNNTSSPARSGTPGKNGRNNRNRINRNANNYESTSGPSGPSPKRLNPEAINATKSSSQPLTTNKTHPRGSSSNSNNSNNSNNNNNADGTRLRNSRPSGRPPTGRIDDAENDKEIATDRTPSFRGSASGSRSIARSDDIRQRGKTVDRSDISSRIATDRQEENASSSGPQIPSSSNNKNNTNGTSRRQRYQRKELAGRAFPTPPAGASSTAEADHHYSAQRQSKRNPVQTVPRTPAKFVHKVEEDRDLMEALTVGLTKSTYDCMVCWDVIRPAHKIWSCQVCWAAFHLDCLSTWAKKSSEVHAILALVLHVEVLVLPNHATAVVNPSSFVALIPTSHSRAESRVIKRAENSWDVANIIAARSAIQDCAHHVKRNKCKSAIVENMSARRAVAMECQKQH
ncbi:Transcriptional repressor NF-X1 [Mortierella sp. AD094]|nr:Transcriptional repressor NF-X1 [Mortierella sp. AD094]